MSPVAINKGESTELDTFELQGNSQQQFQR